MCLCTSLISLSTAEGLRTRLPLEGKPRSHTSAITVNSTSRYRREELRREREAAYVCLCHFVCVSGEQTPRSNHDLMDAD